MKDYILNVNGVLYKVVGNDVFDALDRLLTRLEFDEKWSY